MKENKLKLNPDKTELMVLGDSQCLIMQTDTRMFL